MIAYRVLAHAAFETYFETISNDILDVCHGRFVSEKKADELLLGLCFRFSRLGHLRENQILEKQKGNLLLLVNDAREWHRKNVRENHGIRESNMRDLFLSFGQQVWGLIAPLCTELDAYGVIRGEYAHQSSALVTTPDPNGEMQSSRNILTKIAVFDEAVSSLI